MTKDRYVLWTDINLNFDDWKDDLQSEYPELSENELIEKMYEINADYLDDERVNLNRQLSQPILIIGDLGLWNGRANGYKMIDSGNLKDCLYTNSDMAEWYVDIRGDLRCEAVHHDGTNHYLYRVFKDGVPSYFCLQILCQIRAVAYCVLYCKGGSVLVGFNGVG